MPTITPSTPERIAKIPNPTPIPVLKRDIMSIVDLQSYVFVYTSYKYNNLPITIALLLQSMDGKAVPEGILGVFRLQLHYYVQQVIQWPTYFL